MKGTCAYCDKEGELIQVRGMPGAYHLRCIKEAKEAWASAKPRSALGIILGGR